MAALVYWNTYVEKKVDFLELKDTMFTAPTRAALLTIISTDSHTRMKN